MPAVLRARSGGATAAAAAAAAADVAAAHSVAAAAPVHDCCTAAEGQLQSRAGGFDGGACCEVAGAFRHPGSWGVLGLAVCWRGD